jgi:hypothetical protein
VAEYGVSNSDRSARLTESPVLSNGHAGFGRRAEETDRPKDRYRASVRPHRQWTGKFGQAYAHGLRHRRPRPGDKWHLDEVFIKIRGKNHYLWRAVGQDGNVLDILVTSRRDAKAATRFFRKLLRGLWSVPRVLVTDNWPATAWPTDGRCPVWSTTDPNI